MIFFNFIDSYEAHIKEIMKLKEIEEIMFSLKNLARHFYKRTTAYRRYCYELLREHPNSRHKIDEILWFEIDNMAKEIFLNVKKNGAINGERSLHIEWEIK